MKDVLGNTLKIGDKVAYIQGKNSIAKLAVGKISNIYTTKHDEECSVDGHPHILSFRVLKLEENVK